MKFTLLLSAAFLFVATISQAQKADKAYAITGKNNNNFLWADIKQIDIATGKIVKTLFESDKTKFKSISLEQSKGAVSRTEKPTEFGVAACALDAVHNRLYFSPMHFSEIRFLDLDKSEATFTTVKRNVIPIATPTTYQKEENQITRMVIAADGFGYALSNDASHLIRFSTSNNSVVEDLGSLIDAETNTGFSVHNKCTSWGGDMLADAFGKLVVISASHNVYTIDVKSKIATFKGVITGLPVNFTTNGAAVNNDGEIVVSSANVFEGLYKLNYKDLKASIVSGTDKSFNAADLANGNFLLQQEADAANKFDVSKSLLPVFAVKADAKIFPNPVSGNQFNVLFELQKPGKYTMLFTDLAGRTVSSKVVMIGKVNQTEAFNLTSKAAKGTYLLKVINENKQLAFSERVVLQ
jgi:hypothetical protein